MFELVYYINKILYLQSAARCCVHGQLLQKNDNKMVNCMSIAIIEGIFLDCHRINQQDERAVGGIHNFTCLLD